MALWGERVAVSQQAVWSRGNRGTLIVVQPHAPILRQLHFVATSQWNAAKDAANKRKHGIGFREAAEIFRGYVLTSEDARRDYGERRSIALGEYDGEVIRIVFTERDGKIRIITAWKASRNDRKNYQKARAHRQV
jgi:hypothetical protein